MEYVRQPKTQGMLNSILVLETLYTRIIHIHTNEVKDVY